MGLFAFRKTKWQHKDPAVRLAAIGGIDPRETELLTTLGRDPDQEVRRAAINRLTDVPALSRLAQDADPEDLPVLTARKESLLFQQIVACEKAAEWQDHLAQITSPELLAKLAVEASHPELRLAAVHRIDDQQLLAGILKHNCGKQPAMAALAKITDEPLLADLSESAASKTTRRLAAEKIAEMGRQRKQPDPTEILAQKLQALADEAARLQASPVIDAAVLRLAAIRQEWQALDSEHAHPAYGTFSSICTAVDNRYKEILERRKTEQEKTAGYEQFRTRLEELCTLVERLSCVTDDDAEAAKVQAAAEWEALVNEPNSKMVPSPITTKRFAAACRAFDANREKIRQEKGRVETIEKKCTETRELIAGRDLKKAAARLAEVEKRLAPMKFNYFSKSTLEKLVADVSSELRQAETEIRTRNLTRRLEICAELEQLAQSEDHSHIERQLQTLKQAWQKLTRLEDAEGKELEQRFQKIAAELTGKLKTLAHTKDWQLWANLTLKEKLVGRVAALDQEEDLETVVSVIKEAQVEWKTIGPVPHKESRKLWDEFHDACTRNFERARPFLEERKAGRVAAMERRREICALAAELAESSDWQQTTLAVKGLQEEWKTLPHGSRSEERKLYQQFREACDRFFAHRQVHYQSQDAERSQHLVAKERLCEEAEQLAAAPRIDHSKEFKHLQSAWKKIGPAPRNKEGAVWQRFRAACDTFFQWLAAEQQQNLKRKEELCETAERLVAEATPDNRKEVAAGLAELQQQWKEIGPVAPEQSE
ncbi:MAG: DUF349 domain-containing protein, partial [Desulfobulbaceae bacterium]